jgi:competence protein ComEC
MPATRSFFQRIPFIRITVLFLFGILLQHYLQLNIHILAGLCATLISFLIFVWRNNSFRVLQIHNYLIHTTLILTGAFYPAEFHDKLIPAFERKDYFMAEVCQKPSEKAKSYQTVLQIQNKSMSKPEKVVAYFSKENYDSTLTTGDLIIIIAKPQPIKNMGNPFEFDYRSMMQLRGIGYSLYLAKGTYLKTGKKSDRIIYLAEQIRDQLIAQLTRAIRSKEERSVVSALTLGYRTEISQETTDYFASTGAMHVLSVSGLHVALIYYVLGFFLAFIKHGKAGTTAFAFLMILFLWFYAFISGFSPSVQRATVMFSFVIIGNLLRRPANIYNTLMASALFLILLNPQVIFDVGFQLSYLAVFGIILIQPALNQLITVHNPILKWIWGLTTVSIAAQLTTFPLGLFYFNQFPNLFWLSNFIVIPATTLIIWLTIAFFIVSPIQSIGLYLGFGIQKITHVMLDVLKALDALPFAVTQGIVLNPFQVILLFSCMAAILIFFASKRKGWLLSFLVVVLLFQLNVLYENFRLFNQKAVIVYNSKNLMIHLIDGRKNYLATNKFGNLIETEKLLVEKVGYNLKLNPVNFIEIDQPTTKEINDLFIWRDRIQFINSELAFGFTNSKSLYQDLIDLIIYPAEGNTKMIERKIYTGNSGSFTEQNPDYFSTKRNGAFYASLNQE